MAREITPLSELKLSDNFMFAEVMRNKDMCKLFLEELLQKKIARIEFINKEQVLNDTYLSRGVRLDVYLDDAEGTRYDIEMQNAQEEALERRCRYYQGAVDRNIIFQGTLFEKLPDSYVIFVCDFDYFKRGLALYERESIVAGTDLPYEDGTHVLFLNTHYSKVNVSAPIQEFLDCVKDIDAKKVETLSTNLGALAKELVTTVRNDKSKEVAYMTYAIKMQDERNAGRAEGRAEGEENFTKAMSLLMPAMEAANRMAEFAKAACDRQIARALFQEFGIEYD